MKYIRFKNLGFVMFEATINHSEMSHKLNDTVISAGEVISDDCYDNNKVICRGKSDTLKIQSHEDDTEILRRNLTY